MTACERKVTDTMRDSARRRLEAGGWRVGGAVDFVGLTPGEAAFVELRLDLALYLRELRRTNSWTQCAVAEKLGSSQSRVAKMEAADPSVSVDLLVRALLSLGATREDVGRVVGRVA
jgi:hypothetical protein